MRQTRPFAVYATAAIVFGAGSARGLALPLYADHIGAARSEVGLLFTVFMMPAALLSVPSGAIADRIGRRRSVVFSVLLQGFSQLLAGMTGSVPLLFVSQAVGGFGAGITQTVLMAALADAVPMQRMGRAMGWFTLAMQTGFLAGPAIAGVLLGWLANDYQRVILITGAPLLPALLLAAIGLGDSQHGRPASIQLIEPLRRLAVQPGFAALVLGLLASTMIWGNYQAYVPVLGRNGFGLGSVEVGLLLAIVSVVNAASRLPGGWLTDRLERKGPLVAGCIAVFAAGQLLIPHLHGFWMPVLLMSATIPFLAVAFLAIGVVFAQMAPVGQRGPAMGVYSSILYFGLGFGPAIFAPAMDRGFVLGFTMAGAATLALTGLTLLARVPATRRRREAALAQPPG